MWNINAPVRNRFLTVIAKGGGEHEFFPSHGQR